MLTLSEIKNPAASTYSNLFKDVYGSRPRNIQFESEADFLSDYEFLVGQLDRQMEQDTQREREAVSNFELRLNEVMFITENMNRNDAIRILIQAEDLEKDVEWYGYESLEFELGLPYGYIKGTL